MPPFPKHCWHGTAVHAATLQETAHLARALGVADLPPVLPILVCCPTRTDRMLLQLPQPAGSQVPKTRCLSLAAHSLDFRIAGWQEPQPRCLSPAADSPEFRDCWDWCLCMHLRPQAHLAHPILFAPFPWSLLRALVYATCCRQTTDGTCYATDGTDGTEEYTPLSVFT